MTDPHPLCPYCARWCARNPPENDKPKTYPGGGNCRGFLKL